MPKTIALTDHATFDYLDSVAARVREGRTEFIRGLSRGQTLYVAFAANRPDLLDDEIVPCLCRLGSEWLVQLIARHRYDG